mgnify:CR=1 FL=1
MRFVLLALTTLLLTACTGGQVIDDSFSSRSQSSRVQYIVVHYAWSTRIAVPGTPGIAPGKGAPG